jgi:hypothetical protein
VFLADEGLFVWFVPMKALIVHIMFMPLKACILWLQPMRAYNFVANPFLLLFPAEYILLPGYEVGCRGRGSIPCFYLFIDN